MNQLSGKKLLVLVSNGVDEHVMSHVQRELLKSGAAVKTVGTEQGLVNSWNAAANSWGLYFPVDQQIGQTLGADFDALIVPSGARGIQKLGGNPHAERIISGFIASGKPMVFMGDAVELLVKTGVAKDWKVSGPEKLEATMQTAGAIWQGTGETVHNIMMTGDVSDVTTFIGSMISWLSGNSDMKAAA
jgi:protease I